VVLKDPGVKVELTATNRVGLHRYTFPRSDSAHVLLDLVSSIYNYDGKVPVVADPRRERRLVTGFRQTRAGPRPPRLLRHRVLAALQTYGLVNDAVETYKGFGRTGRAQENYPQMGGRKLKAHFDFRPPPATPSWSRWRCRRSGSTARSRTCAPRCRAGLRRGEKAAREAWARALDKVEIEGDGSSAAPSTPRSTTPCSRR
jgi:hypothetical protein